MTDADYVLAAYRELGDDSVHKLLGDWAIVIWDSVERKLFCAKDPIGWRQLYYAESDGLLLVGSEPQQLFAGGWVPRKWTMTTYCGTWPTPYGTRQGRAIDVRDLDGGAHLSVHDLATVVKSTYWESPKITPRSYSSPREYVEEFVDVFAEATRARLRSNRSVGVYLSGGLDSSYVSAIALHQGVSPLAISSYAPGTRLWTNATTSI